MGSCSIWFHPLWQLLVLVRNKLSGDVKCLVLSHLFGLDSKGLVVVMFSAAGGQGAWKEGWNVVACGPQNVAQHNRGSPLVC
jgi:hypothetical protein